MSLDEEVRVACEAIREKIAAAALRSGRTADEIHLLAVTKFHPFEAVIAAHKAGIRLFGENRVQEAEQKFGTPEAEALPGVSLHMIGNLQSNKIGKAVYLFHAIQSIGDSECLRKVASRARALEKPLGLYLELHTGEATKGGFPSVDAMLYAIEDFLASAYAAAHDSGMAGPSLQGLMTMAPFLAEGMELRQAFRKLASARTIILEKFREIPDLQLSMGMSGDFEVAIEEGSTLVRIGSALFGERTGQ